MEDSTKIYEVKVNTGGSLDIFKTNDENLFKNVHAGNADFVFFKTTEGAEVMVPCRFMVIVKEI